MISTSLRILRLENRLYMAQANDRPVIHATARRRPADDGLPRRWARWLRANPRAGSPAS